MKSKKERAKDPFWKIPAWSSRSISVAVAIILLNQIVFYSTEVLGLNVAIVGTIFLIVKIIDAFANFGAGYLIDKLNLKLGKGRPYELLVIPLWVLIVMFFSTPDFGNTGKLVYIFVIYTMITSVCQTTLMASEHVYLGRAIDDNAKRGKTLAISGVLVMFLSAVASMILPNLMATYGMQEGGWTFIAMVYAIPMILLGLVRFFAIKEVKVVKEEVKASDLTLKENVSLMVKNKYLLMVSVLVFLAFLLQNTMSVVGTYYFSYIMGDLSLFGMVGMIGMFAPLVLLLFPWATKKFGSENFIRIGLIIAVLTSVIRFFFPTDLPVILITVTLTGIGASVLTMLNSYFIIQCIEYGELKFGKRLEGMSSALMSFSINLGQGISVAFVGFVMAAFGYVQSSAVQSEAALLSISGLYSLFPAIAALLMLIVLSKFDVSKQIKILKDQEVQTETK